MTIDFNSWLVEFSKDKKVEAVFGTLPEYSLQSVIRYKDLQGLYWETGFTYTDRLVVRFGQSSDDSKKIVWGDWVTLHDVVC